MKREKQADDSEQVVAHLKLGEITLTRDQLDEICGQPISWSSDALFDELGAPRARLSLALTPRGKVTFSGVIDGGKKSTDPNLRLKDADVDGIELALTALGSVLSCQLSWVASGDEVDDIADMLGMTCNVVAVLDDGGQGDLLDSAVRNVSQLAQQDGIESVELQIGGKTIATFGKGKKGMPVSSASDALKLLQKGWVLVGESPSFELESPGGKSTRGIWLNAANSCLKRGLECVGGDNIDGFRYVWRKSA